LKECANAEPIKGTVSCCSDSHDIFYSVSTLERKMDAIVMWSPVTYLLVVNIILAISIVLTIFLDIRGMVVYTPKEF